MLDLAEKGLLSESDSPLENEATRGDTAELFTFDRYSTSSAIIVNKRTGVDSIDSELDWKNVATSLPPMRSCASKFLNPSPTPRTCKNTIESCSSPASSEASTKINSILWMESTSLAPEPTAAPLDVVTESKHKRSHTSPSLILPQNERGHLRSISGTPIITGICNVLPDEFDVPSPTSVNPELHITEARERMWTNSQKSAEDDDYWSINEDGSDAECVGLTVDKREKRVQKELSRRGSELVPPNKIWITGGPYPGLYSKDGKLNGRPKWLGAEAQVCWCPDARGWLLISKQSSELDAALAMLCVDSNHPCITTTKWRVGKGAKKGVSHSFYETYAFKVDNSMLCTKYVGSSRELLNEIEESTLVKVRRGIGIVRFVGPLEDKSGMFAGVELFSPTGLNDGTRKGFFYFEAKPKHGVFVRVPHAVKQNFGPVSDRVATFMDDLLETAGRVKEISEAAIERLMKIMVLLGNDESVFCGRKINVLGIILFYDLVML